MTRPLHRLSPLLIVALLTCGKDATAPDEPGPPTDVAGTWTYYEILENTQQHITCFDQGTIAIAQTEADLTGTVTQFGSCDVPGGSVDNSGTASISGNVGASTVRFAFAGCAYHGDLFNTPRDSARGTVDCNANLGAPFGRIELTGTWWAIKGTEFLPPVVSGTINAPPGDTMFVTGETFRLTIAASDDRKLHWVGYRLGAPANVQDSTLTVDTTFRDTVDFVVPASWEGASNVTVWARDASDKSTEQVVGHVRALNAVRRPSQTIALGVRSNDAAYDPARNVMYFAQPESARVAVLSLGTFTFSAPIAVPLTPRGGSPGIDLTPGGDTLIVPFGDTAQVALLDRVAGTVSRVTIGGGARYIFKARVTADRHAFVYGERDSAFYVIFSIWDRNLATGTDTVRYDVGQGHVGIVGAMVRSPDQSKLLVLEGGCGFLYDAATGNFSACSSFAFSSFAIATGTTNGDKWLVGDKLLDGSLSVLATVPGLGLDTYAGIAPDGTVAYRPASYGYDKIALPSGAVLERVRIRAPVTTRISVFPEGNRLFLWSDPIGSPPLWATDRATVVTLP
jgi:hypothetical protein